MYAAAVGARGANNTCMYMTCKQLNISTALTDTYTQDVHDSNPVIGAGDGASAWSSDDLRYSVPGAWESVSVASDGAWTAHTAKTSQSRASTTASKFSFRRKQGPSSNSDS